MDDRQKYEMARKRVEAKIGLYIHAGVYLAVNALLAGINLITTPQDIWFIYPLAGWGMGLIFHFALVYSGFSISGWKKRMIDRELDNLK